ncbi:hypothetical protein GA0115253_1053711 [Streptomyces sp. Termitarium-T10T-6]|nr:hypothetical protein GA0115253_1053711 [Streptomyces sp. Termitarium-T10T-6]
MALGFQPAPARARPGVEQPVVAQLPGVRPGRATGAVAVLDDRTRQLRAGGEQPREHPRLGVPEHQARVVVAGRTDRGDAVRGPAPGARQQPVLGGAQPALQFTVAGDQHIGGPGLAPGRLVRREHPVPAAPGSPVRRLAGVVGRGTGGEGGVDTDVLLEGVRPARADRRRAGGGTRAQGLDHARAAPHRLRDRPLDARAERAERAVLAERDPACAALVEPAGDGRGAAPARGHPQAYGTGVDVGAIGQDLVGEVGRAAVRRRPPQRGAHEAAGEEDRLAVVRDPARRGGVAQRLLADAHVDAGPAGQRGDRLPPLGDGLVRRVQPGDERAVVAGGVERPAGLLPGGRVSGAGGGDPVAEIAVADVRVVAVGLPETGGGRRPGGVGGVPAGGGRPPDPGPGPGESDGRDRASDGTGSGPAAAATGGSGAIRAATTSGARARTETRGRLTVRK